MPIRSTVAEIGMGVGRESSLEGDWDRGRIQNHGKWWKEQSVFNLDNSLPIFWCLCGGVKEGHRVLERTWDLEGCH